jgi:hypothetical protein
MACAAFIVPLAFRAEIAADQAYEGDRFWLEQKMGSGPQDQTPAYFRGRVPRT